MAEQFSQAAVMEDLKQLCSWQKRDWRGYELTARTLEFKVMLLCRHLRNLCKFLEWLHVEHHMQWYTSLSDKICLMDPFPGIWLLFCGDSWEFYIPSWDDCRWLMLLSNKSIEYEPIYSDSYLFLIISNKQRSDQGFKRGSNIFLGLAWNQRSCYHFFFHWLVFKTLQEK